MDVVKATVGSAMERALSAHASGNKRVVAWLPEIDRILIVGMKHGPQGIREATSKVLALRAGLTRADCWKRLRVLRETANGSASCAAELARRSERVAERGISARRREKAPSDQSCKKSLPWLAKQCPFKICAPARLDPEGNPNSRPTSVDRTRAEEALGVSWI